MGFAAHQSAYCGGFLRCTEGKGVVGTQQVEGALVVMGLEHALVGLRDKVEVEMVVN